MQKAEQEAAAARSEAEAEAKAANLARERQQVANTGGLCFCSDIGASSAVAKGLLCLEIPLQRLSYKLTCHLVIWGAQLQMLSSSDLCTL